MKKYRRILRRLVAMLLHGRPRSIEETLNLVHKSCFFSGIRLLHDSPSRFLDNVSVLYPMLLMGTFCSGFFTHAFNWEHRDRLQLAQIANFVSTRYAISIVFWHVFCGLYNSKSYHSCAKRLAEVDKTLTELGASSTHRRDYFLAVNSFAILVLLICICVTAFVLVLRAYLGQSYFRVFYIGMLRSYSEILGGVITISYVLSVSFIRDRFARINVLLRAVKLNDDLVFHNTGNFKKAASRLKRCALMVSCVNTIRLEKRNRLIQTVRQIHLELIQISKKLEEVFGLQLFMEMLRSGIMLVILSYSAYSQGSYISLTVFSCVLQALKILLVSRASALAINEANRTIEIVHEISVRMSDPVIKDEIRQFCLQMLLLPLNFTAHGFFTLNFRFVKTITVEISTYFVILIQIGDSLNESDAMKQLSANRTSS